MEIFGYIASLFIGITLGLIGGGGSILTVPVLVYLFGITPLAATSYSLFIVGITSLVGSLNNLRQRQVDLRTVFLFGMSSVLTVFIFRRFIIPEIPGFVSIGSLHISFSTITMVVFAMLMLLASISMINGRNETESAHRSKKPATILIYGVGIGIVTGFLGAGGGFLMIPAFVYILKLPMKKAIGTSLFIISINSLIGFAGDAGNFEWDWRMLFIITALAIAGVIIGDLLGNRLNGSKLKRGFGWFVLIMGLYIIANEIWL